MCTHRVQNKSNVMHSEVLLSMIFIYGTKLPKLDICTSHYETHLLQINTICFYTVSYVHREKK